MDQDHQFMVLLRIMRRQQKNLRVLSQPGYMLQGQLEHKQLTMFFIAKPRYFDAELLLKTGCEDEERFVFPFQGRTLLS